MAIAIIFSKDRPAQLHLLLESIWNNTEDELFSQILVITKASNREYTLGYNEVQKCFPFPDVRLLWQYDFKSDVLVLLKEHQQDKYVCFFTDDDIVYQNIDLTQKALDTIFSVNEVGLISLRLGTNTVVQDIGSNMATHVPPLRIVHFSEVSEEMVFWNWTTCPHHLDFGYPLSVDGHIFRIEQIIPIIESIEAPNPNVLEGNMCHRISMLPPLAVAYIHSKVVNTPINRVQDDFTNRHGDFFPRSQYELNNLYLSDKRIDLNTIDFSNIFCSHQELEMELK